MPPCRGCTGCERPRLCRGCGHHDGDHSQAAAAVFYPCTVAACDCPDLDLGGLV